MSLHYHPDFRHFIAIVIVLAIVGQWRQGYFRSFSRSLKEVSWGSRLRELVLFLIFIPLIIGVDKIILDYVQAPASPAILGPLAHWARFISNNTRFWTVLTSAYFLLLILRRRKEMRFVFGILMAAALSGLICHLLKFLILRARPLVGVGRLSFFNYHPTYHTGAE